MSENTKHIHLLELTNLDVSELKKNLGDKIIISPNTISSYKAGEPLTFTATIILSPLVLYGITLWLLKRRIKYQTEFKWETEYPDGKIERRSVRFNSDSSLPPTKETIEQVGKIFEMDEM